PPAPTTTYSRVFPSQRTKIPSSYVRVCTTLSTSANSPPNHRPKLSNRSGCVLVALTTSHTSGTSEYTSTTPVSTVSSTLRRGWSAEWGRRRGVRRRTGRAAVRAAGAADVGVAAVMVSGLLAHAAELDHVGDDHRDDAHDDRDRGRVVVLLAREGQRVGVEVRREVRRDRVGRERLEDARLVEELERPDDREDRRDDERAADRRELDGRDDAPLARAVELRRLVERRGDHAQRGVEDEHVVAHELPGHDVADRREHEVRRQRVGQGDPERVVDVAHEPEPRAVHEAPHEGGDDRGHRVRQEDRDPEERLAVEPAAVERERDEERDAEHDRHLHHEEERDAPERLPELRVGERP